MVLAATLGRIARFIEKRYTQILAGIFVVAVSPAVKARGSGYFDWRLFHSIGASIGSARLIESGFAYLPGVAWLFLPAALLPIAAGYATNAIVVILAAVSAALVAARNYEMEPARAVAMTLGWPPVAYALVTGQNSVIGLLLIMIFMRGVSRGNDLLAGLSLGLLCYKPTYAIPLIVWLIVEKRIVALCVSGVCLLGWYIASALAVGGDWMWIAKYSGMLPTYFRADFTANAMKAMSAPALLVRAGVSPIAAAALGFAVLVAAIVLNRKAAKIEAVSAACLLGLATSPHAWDYDAVLVLPMLFAMLQKHTQLARYALFVSYGLALAYLFVAELPFNPLSVVVVGGALAYAGSRWHATRSAV